LQAALYRITHDPSKPISDYITAVLTMRDCLNAVLPATEKVSDTYVKYLLLQNLDESYGVTCSSLLSQTTEPSLSTCISVLQGAVPSNFNPVVKAEEILDDAGLLHGIDTALVVRGGQAGPGGFRSGGNGGARGVVGNGGASHRGGGGYPHASGEGYVDSNGNHWCNMNAEGCHRCGGHSHKAVCCVKEMPKEVKDWCLNRTYDSAY
ncbi:hypothetical protein F5880DRAFT_1463264, partial [Lentinula raphanica]